MFFSELPMKTTIDHEEKTISLFFAAKTGDETLWVVTLVQRGRTIFGVHFPRNQTVLFVNGAGWCIFLPG